VIVSSRDRRRLASALLILASTAGLMLLRAWLPSWLSTFQYRGIVDETLLAREPLQIGDLRVAVNSATAAAGHQNWRLATRLIRDGRSQWEAFQAGLPSTPHAARWSAADIRRFTALWNTTVKQAESRSLPGLRRAAQRLLAVMDRNRLPLQAHRWHGLAASMKAGMPAQPIFISQEENEWPE
jgi:hypothetical protein